MSPRRSSLSRNQKITISLSIMAIIVMVITSFISGHVWFPNTPSSSEPDTAVITPSQPPSLTPEFTGISTTDDAPTVSGELSQIFVATVAASSGSLAPVNSSSCLWTEASRRGDFVEIMLEGESTVEKLRIALFGNHVTRVLLTFSDGSQQTSDLMVFRDYEYQDVFLEPVKTSSIRVEVQEVQDDFASNFGICHIEVFGAKP
jgi:hypothetical protein